MQWLALKLHSCVYPEQMQTQNDKHDPNPLLYGRRGRLGGWRGGKKGSSLCLSAPRREQAGLLQPYGGAAICLPPDFRLSLAANVNVTVQ